VRRSGATLISPAVTQAGGRIQQLVQLEPLEVLIGEWDTEFSNRGVIFRGHTVFEWLPGRAFVVQR
jgi:hypothetical protein